MMATDFIYRLYSDKRTVFTLQEIGMLTDEPDFIKLRQRIHYFVKKGRLRNLRRGIYSKNEYSSEELACKIYSPSYISLEYVLQKVGVIFQYSNQLTVVSYLSRAIEVDGNSLHYSKIKNDILYDTIGIIRIDNGINIATPERAFMDCLYLNKRVATDSVHNLNGDLLRKIMLVYNSEELRKKADIFF